MIYELIFLPEANEDIKRIKKTGNRALMKKLTSLLEEISEHPKTGTGKPEQLKHYKIPTWSRRISKEHRVNFFCKDSKCMYSSEVNNLHRLTFQELRHS